MYERIANGDEVAFRQAHDLFKARLFYYAKRFRLEWEEVKDVVAEAFLHLWNGRSQLQSNDHLKNFLYFAVRNQALKALEARNKHQSYTQSTPLDQTASADHELISHRIIEAEMGQLLADGIARLAPDYRRIFELSYYEGKNPREIAALMAMNPATVRSQKRRAIEMLREWIRKRSFLLLLPVSFLTADLTPLKKILDFLARKG
ncbi:MAG: sigma-70 family RNA polymerase sigma factor [Candidatus Pseudobacter hemicellulosilyticus]|uniref:Sigma-70 family RNA polymerase sigma factor n=1 Tax=Candidatus Pseudobacter hemicellulosilyticus TaxID=3121375 RepID=A0AAJ6BGM0_9BACT|nr:MAG: sigma-70 family RNA polymerase sigma factor [Pseudobacter sp.]